MSFCFQISNPRLGLSASVVATEKSIQELAEAFKKMIFANSTSSEPVVEAKDSEESGKEAVTTQPASAEESPGQPTSAEGTPKEPEQPALVDQQPTSAEGTPNENAKPASVAPDPADSNGGLPAETALDAPSAVALLGQDLDGEEETVPGSPQFLSKQDLKGMSECFLVTNRFMFLGT